ncbi:MAG: hypothetical protein KGP14_16875 [Betaproteobacteria bacterium]|nr:hypothetical protein [Rhodospirillales bacterium]MDE2442689.1 hypothetical protein [Betaproteobacteria bacterium]
MKGNTGHKTRNDRAGADDACPVIPFDPAISTPSTTAKINPSFEPHHALLQLVELIARAAAEADFHTLRATGQIKMRRFPSTTLSP